MFWSRKNEGMIYVSFMLLCCCVFLYFHPHFHLSERFGVFPFYSAICGMSFALIVWMLSAWADPTLYYNICGFISCMIYGSCIGTATHIIFFAERLP